MEGSGSQVGRFFDCVKVELPMPRDLTNIADHSPSAESS
jgi:hypothetical protein